MNGDYRLIRQMRQGEEAAFDAFVRKYYGQILKYCLGHCFDEEFAKDLTQETFLRFFNHFSDYRHEGKAKQYLYTIAGNLCRNYYGKKTEMPVDSLTDMMSVETPMDGTDEKMAVAACMAKLPEEMREVLLLYYYQELKISEIARICGIGVPLVKYWLRRAKQMMKKIMEVEGWYEV